MGGDMLDCMVPAIPMNLKRFRYRQSKNAKSHTEAYNHQSKFCESEGGRLPTRTELCPKDKPAFGCERSHSWVPYAGSADNWMYIGCPGTGHVMCQDHMTANG